MEVVSPLRAERVAQAARDTAAIRYKPVTITAKSTETPLSLDLVVNVVKSARARCPRCGNRRVLFHLAAWAKGSPSGAGEAMCAACAGFREPDEARAARRTR